MNPTLRPLKRVSEVLTDLPRRFLVLLVRGYRFWLKPWLGQSCRFEPTCSQYALTALERHGALVGAGLTVARLSRCHPWCAGGCDPVPDRAPGLFRRLGLGETVPEPITRPHDENATPPAVPGPPSP